MDQVKIILRPNTHLFDLCVISGTNGMQPLRSCVLRLFLEESRVIEVNEQTFSTIVLPPHFVNCREFKSFHDIIAVFLLSFESGPMSRRRIFVYEMSR